MSVIAQLLAHATAGPPMPTAIAHPCDDVSLLAAVEAAERGLITPILVGPEQKIRDTAAAHKLDISALPDRRHRRTAMSPPPRPSPWCARARPSC